MEWFDQFLSGFTQNAPSMLTVVPGAGPAIAGANAALNARSAQDKRNAEQAGVDAVNAGVPAPAQAQPGTIEAAQNSAVPSPTTAGGEYIGDVVWTQDSGDHEPTYKKDSGAEQYAWQELLSQGKDAVLQQKRELAAAGYYGNDTPIYTKVITQEDIDAINLAMGEANRSRLPTYQDAIARRTLEATDSTGRSTTPAERARMRADYHTAVNDLEAFAYDNGIRLSNKDIARWAGRAVDGSRTLDQTKAHLTDKFIARSYPALKDDLKAGFSVREVAAPYLSAMTELLGDVNPDVHDPLVRKALQGRTEKGEPTLMPLWQFEEEVKKDKRYQYSDKAWEDEGNMFANIMQMFGVL